MKTKSVTSVQQKIVMKIPMNGQEAVESIAIEGKEGDQLVVIGTGVDVIKLLKALRKKLKLHADIISVAEVKDGDEAKSAEKKAPSATSEAIYVHYPPYTYPTYSMGYDPVPNTCSIL
ncbi:hypothetical protein ACMD2_15424 [Ananas comosus]|uniref:Heavy metal-associated isoprenylated plant protein 47-like n=1 Tax=Ananas comosus TaxID=4615 RepID=A0A199UEX5_ANACO|nr:hypothetical protein ACMD2_15424 [Ananas comosus]